MTLPLRFLAALLVALGATCCARHDPETLGYFKVAMAANRVADQLVQKGETTAAGELLRIAADRPAPAGAQPDDARIVRQDLYYRVADLALATGSVDAATRAASKGIELGRGTDVFTANLLIVRGRAFEQGKDVASASRDYHDALVITDKLLEERLRGAPKGP